MTPGVNRSLQVLLEREYSFGTLLMLRHPPKRASKGPSPLTLIRLPQSIPHFPLMTLGDT